MRVVSVLCLFFSWMWPRSGPWRSRHRTSSTRSCASGTTSSTASPRMKRKRCLKDPRAFWSLGNICFNVSKSDQSYRLVYLELSTAVVKYEPIYSGPLRLGKLNSSLYFGFFKLFFHLKSRYICHLYSIQVTLAYLMINSMIVPLYFARKIVLPALGLKPTTFQLWSSF